MGFLNLFKRSKEKEETKLTAKAKLKQVNPIDLLFEDVGAKSTTYYSFEQRCNMNPEVWKYCEKGFISKEDYLRIYKVRDDAYWNFSSSAGFATRDDAVERLTEDRFLTLEKALKKKKGNVQVVFVAPKLHVADIYVEQVEVTLSGGMKADEIKKKYNEGVGLIDEEWVKSGKLKAFQEDQKMKADIEAKEQEERWQEREKREAALEAEIKDEKLDVSGHELYFKDFEEGKLHDSWGKEERAIIWGKLLQMEKRKHGHYTEEIVTNTFSKAYGGDGWDIAHDLGVTAWDLAHFWKDLPEVMAKLPAKWFGSIFSKKGYLKGVCACYDKHADASYEKFREDKLAKIRAENEKEEARERKTNYLMQGFYSAVDILALKEKIMKKELGDKVGKTGDVATGEVREEHRQTAKTQVEISKTLMNAKREKEGKGE